MVAHCESHGDTASMNGDRSSAGPPSPALAGCLGKAEGTGEITGDCPWCSAKGQTSALRSYAVNFKESITLCSNPLCLFPLISRPLEDVHFSLSSSKGKHPCKRKSCLLEAEDPNSAPKRQKREPPDVMPEATDCRVSTKPFEEKLCASGHKAKKVVASDGKPCTEAPTIRNEDPVLFEASQNENFIFCAPDEAGEANLMDVAVQDLIEMVPAPVHLFWKNKDNLCWLDSLLVALVHLRLTCTPWESVSWTDLGKNYTVRSLCARYKKTCAYLKTKEQNNQGNVQIPSDVLLKAEQELEALQLSVFHLLQPKLQCELGQKETPVFALPLLLKTDEWAHSLFQHTGEWEFKCTSCHYVLNTSVEKTLTTFTQLTADWHPLRAVHRTQCSKCSHKNQKRKLVFQRLSSVLALHFVEGLPRRDVSRYSFDFQGTHYAIRTIIQYNEQLEHFITWIYQPDGTWLEFDDLKYPSCITHRRFTLRASQFHLVFWEAESRKGANLPEPMSEEDTHTVDMGNESTCSQDMTSSITNDTCIIEALTVNDDKNEASGLDSSICNTTLLDTFEGLSHRDIVTLTLVEVKVDSEGKPLPNTQETKSGISEPTIQVKTSANQDRYVSKHKINVAKDISSTPLAPVINLPSVQKTTPAAKVLPQVNQHPILPSKPSVSSMSFLLQKHPSHQSTPLRVPVPASQPKLDLRCEGNEALPAKPAELFGGFRGKNSSPVLPGGVLRQTLGSQPTISVAQKAFSHCNGTSDPFQTPEILKSASKRTSGLSATKLALSTTDALRLKLMKKLKAKKKKLAKLNQLLGKGEGESFPRPDSTDLTSPYSVTSSTSVYDSPVYDHFFAELLSPATTSSNLSPDSTGLLEMLSNSQGGEPSDNSPQENLAVDKADFLASMHSGPPVNDPSPNNEFFDEFISGSGVQQSEIENADFNALDMFF